MAEKWQINKTHIASVYENGIRWLMLQEQKKEEIPKKKKLDNLQCHKQSNQCYQQYLKFDLFHLLDIHGCPCLI